MHGPARPLATVLAVTFLACAGSGDASGSDGDYLRYVAFEAPGNEYVVLRWPEREMPLKVHLPTPPEGLFREPEAVVDAVRDGFNDWTDVAGPGLPRFEFVDTAGQADIPVVWELEPSGDWYIAHCAYDINPMQRRFGVSRILVTARYGNLQEARLEDLYVTMLHEVGHGLGLLGHSPVPGDVMYPHIGTQREPYLSARDRETLRKLYARPIGSRVAGGRDFEL